MCENEPSSLLVSFSEIRKKKKNPETLPCFRNYQKQKATALFCWLIVLVLKVTVFTDQLKGNAESLYPFIERVELLILRCLGKLMKCCHSMSSSLFSFLPLKRPAYYNNFLCVWNTKYPRLYFISSFGRVLIKLVL